ncbi:hypothetical protein [Nocardia sp. XZ_19_385]|nr:hypothetical protein [Nocardia sp. XZ_19_385]
MTTITRATGVQHAEPVASTASAKAKLARIFALFSAAGQAVPFHRS